jgi:hypothetical protein
MSNRNLAALSDRELACLAYLNEAKKLGVSFSRYCREKELKLHEWGWVKRVLIRKGVIDGRRRAERTKPAGFAPVRMVAAAAAMTTAAAATVCRIRHPSGWTIECASYPEVSWMTALMSGAAS